MNNKFALVIISLTLILLRSSNVLGNFYNGRYNPASIFMPGTLSPTPTPTPTDNTTSIQTLSAEMLVDNFNHTNNETWNNVINFS